MKIGSKVFVRLVKMVLWPLCLAPVAILLLSIFGQLGYELGANPIEDVLHTLGKWGLKFLLITLAITPLRRWTGINWLIQFRRLMGLFSFFYILLHFLTYFVLDQSLDLAAVLEDILKRPYITLGMTALLFMLPLALTSTRGMMRRLGGRWKKLHRLVYAIGILGVWHFYWQVKLDTLEPTLYVVILAVLLGYRIWFARQKSS
ncbi:MAG: sulfoxide reductase heme-binding subunit YedZ [Lysobacterales bacterium]|jgi:sulfoxide reductase heme-binding subunit YedZ